VDEGRIFFGTEDVTALAPQARGTAMVFQHYALWPHMTVFDNVAYGLRLRKLPEADVRRRVEQVLGLVEIGRSTGVMQRRPGSPVASSNGWRSRGRSWWSHGRS
jgi:ABC-type sugar transport system ATPase subunit